MDYSCLNSILIDVVKDIEEKCRTVHCYAYPKTIRSILTAAEKSPIAPHFSDKYYYGKFSYLSLGKLEETLLMLCNENKLCYTIHKDKKRFGSVKGIKKNNQSNTEVYKGLTKKDYDEISSLLDDFI